MYWPLEAGLLSQGMHVNQYGKEEQVDEERQHRVKIATVKKMEGRGKTQKKDALNGSRLSIQVDIRPLLLNPGYSSASLPFPGWWLYMYALLRLPAFCFTRESKLRKSPLG